MTWPLPWWAYILIWWAGMIPTAIIGGALQRDRVSKGDAPYPDSALIILVVAWPVWAATFPVVVSYLIGRKDKANGKSKR